MKKCRELTATTFPSEYLALAQKVDELIEHTTKLMTVCKTRAHSAFMVQVERRFVKQFIVSQTLGAQ